MQLICKHCGLRVYQPPDRPGDYAHHGSNMRQCFGGLMTVAEPAIYTKDEAELIETALRFYRNALDLGTVKNMTIRDLERRLHDLVPKVETV